MPGKLNREQFFNIFRCAGYIKTNKSKNTIISIISITSVNVHRFDSNQSQHSQSVKPLGFYQYFYIFIVNVHKKLSLKVKVFLIAMK